MIHPISFCWRISEWAHRQLHPVALSLWSENVAGTTELVDIVKALQVKAMSLTQCQIYTIQCICHCLNKSQFFFLFYTYTGKKLDTTF